MSAEQGDEKHEQDRVSQQRRTILSAGLSIAAGNVLFPNIGFAEEASEKYENTNKFALTTLADEWEGFKKSRTFKRAGKDIEIAQAFNEQRKNGLAVYEGNLVLTSYMEELTPKYWQGKKVLELGCGTGLGSITASLLGASMVTASDREPAVLALAESNLERNIGGRGQKYSMARVNWGTDQCAPDTAAYMRDMGQCWAPSARPQGGYDVVIGADLTYTSGLVPNIIDTIQKLGSDNVEVIFCWCEPALFTWNSNVMDELNEGLRAFDSAFSVNKITTGNAFKGHDNTFVLRMTPKPRSAQD